MSTDRSTPHAAVASVPDAHPAEPTPPHRFSVVGIGASAGGLKALQAFFEALPADSGMVYVVILHLDPGRESQMAELLQGRTSIPVDQVTAPVVVEPNHAYIIPPGKNLSMVDGTIQLSERGERRHQAPIDLFFRTLADVYGPAAVGIVLSGTGSDGASGLRSIKEHGGITIVQDPEEAEYDGMPRSAIDAGQVDLVMSVGAMPGKLVTMIRNHPRIGGREAEPGEEEETLLRQIFGRLRGRTGHDFSGYKRATIHRRLDRRMRFNDIRTLSAYVDRLRDDGPELRALFQDLLISVSSFFRDPDAFAVLEQEVIPGIFSGKAADEAVRAWVIGCATGEEAYSIAMLLSEHASTLAAPPHIQVFATDIDEQACAVAREALYPGTISADVSAHRLEQFFDRENNGYRVKKFLRKLVLFASHDVLKDPPFSRLDLVCCRNVLIYLGADAQRRVIEGAHYGLRPDGVLFLGTSESLGDSSLFTPVDSMQRIFRRVPTGHPVIPRPASDAPRVRSDASGDAVEQRPPLGFPYGAAHLRMLEAYAPPSVIVDENARILHLSPQAGSFLRIAGGVPTANILDLAPGEIRLELRTALYRALQKGIATTAVARFPSGDDFRDVEIRVQPHEDRERRMALVVFDKRSEPALRTEDQRAAASGAALPDELRGMDLLQRELLRTREQLDASLRERDITIEELQSTNEELQSINEEHKAANEEMEVSREELQSINEELATVNQEHRGTIEELKQSNADLQNLLEAAEIGTIFLDGRMRVRRFTPTVTKVFHLATADRGRPLEHIAHRLQYDGFQRDAEHAVASLETVERQVTSNTGEWYSIRTRPYRAGDGRIEGVVLTFYDITEQRRFADRLLAMEKRLRLALEIARLGEWELDLRTRKAQRSLRHDEIFGHDARDEWSYDIFLQRVHPDDRAEVDRRFRVAISTSEPWDFECRIIRGDGALRWIWARGRRSDDSTGEARHMVGVVADVTDRRQSEEELRAAKSIADEANSAKSAFVATLSHELRTPLNGILGYADLLLISATLDEQQAGRVARIKAGVWHLAAMVEEILTLAKVDAQKEALVSTTVDARTIAYAAATLVEPNAAAKGLDFQVQLPNEGVDIDTDAGKSRQILLNLLGNAIKYTERGCIRLEVDGNKERVSFLVRDTGIGIAMEHRERVFERFWQVSGGLTRTAGGTGLGLATARELARMLGGDVELESELGQGSVFTFWLPRSRGAAPGDAEVTERH